MLDHTHPLRIVCSVRFLDSIGLLLLLACDESYAQRHGGIAGYFPPPGRPPIFNPSPPLNFGRPALPPRALNPGGLHPFGPRGYADATIVPYLVPYPASRDEEYYPESSAGGDTLQDDAPPARPGQTIIIVMPPQQAPPPEGVHQDAQETRQSVPAEDLTGRSNEPAQFFIALKDHSVYSAVAYWVQGETLHYVTAPGSHNLVSLALVDRTLTARLNAKARVPLVLPPE